MGLLILAAALADAAYVYHFQSSAARVSGEVERLYEDGCVGGRCACAVIGYAPRAGAPERHFVSAYCRPADKYYSLGRYWPGTPVEVLVRAGDPPAAELGDPWLLYNDPRGLAILGLLWLLGASFVNGRNVRRALREL